MDKKKIKYIVLLTSLVLLLICSIVYYIDKKSKEYTEQEYEKTLKYFTENIEVYNEIARGMLEFDNEFVNAYMDSDKIIFGNGSAGTISNDNIQLQQKIKNYYKEVKLPEPSITCYTYADGRKVWFSYYYDGNRMCSYLVYSESDLSNKGYEKISDNWYFIVRGLV